MLQQFFGTELDLWVRLAVSLIVIIALLGVTAFIIRRMGRKSAMPMIPRPRTGRARLSIVDAVPVDQDRRLVLVRRDDTEHLLLTGGTADVVIEANIPVRGEAHASVQEAITPLTPEQASLRREAAPPVAAPLETPALPERTDKMLEPPPVSIPAVPVPKETPSQPYPAIDPAPFEAEDTALRPAAPHMRPGAFMASAAPAIGVAAAAAANEALASEDVRPRMPSTAQLASPVDELNENDRDDEDEAETLPDSQAAKEGLLISEDDLLDSGDLIITGPNEEDEDTAPQDGQTDDSEAAEREAEEAEQREVEALEALIAAEIEEQREAEEAARREAEVLAAMEAEQRAEEARAEAERIALEAAEREEAERAALEAAERAALEAAEREAVEQAMIEAAEREAWERAEAERIAMEAARLERERLEAEAQAEAERIAQEEREREEAERALAEAAEAAALEAFEREAREREEAERVETERAAAERAEAERAAMEAARLDLERLEAEAQAEAERLAREEAERVEAERALAEAAEAIALEAEALETLEREEAERTAALKAAEALDLDAKIAAEMADALQAIEKERMVLPEEEPRTDNSQHLSLSDLLDDLEQANPVAGDLSPAAGEAPAVEPMAPMTPATEEPRRTSRFGSVFGRSNSSYGRPRIDATPRQPASHPPLRAEPYARPRPLAGTPQSVPMLGSAQQETGAVETGRDLPPAPRIRPPAPMTSRRPELLPQTHAEDRIAPPVVKADRNDPSSDFLEDFESEIANLLGRTPTGKP